MGSNPRAPRIEWLAEIIVGVNLETDVGTGEFPARMSRQMSRPDPSGNMTSSTISLMSFDSGEASRLRLSEASATRKPCPASKLMPQFGDGVHFKAIITASDHPLRAKTEVIIFPTARGRKKDARRDLIEVNRSGSSAKDPSSQNGTEKLCGRVRCAPSYMDGGFGSRRCVWCLQ
jgi:hypothetical protein